jgi:hypothetical protein
MMQLRHAPWFAALGLLAGLAACKNPHYCAGNPNDDCRLDGGGSSAQACGSDSDCTTAGTMVCDVAGSKQCVACTTSEAGACMAMTPVCGSDDTCRACAAHSECASAACLPDGSCGDASNVAYVAEGATDNATCDQMHPCLTVPAALATKRPYVKLHGMIDGPVMLVDQPMVTWLADPGATLTSTTIGNVLTLGGSSQVAIYDLEITGSLGAASVGISVPAGSTVKLDLHRAKVTSNGADGLQASSGTITVDGATFSGNQGLGINAMNNELTVSRSMFISNQKGGIAASNLFVIVGNTFFSNGSNTSAVGGVSVQTPAIKSRLDFNSFSLNTTVDTIGAGIQCLGTFTASNNIMANNREASTMNQTGGNCSHTYSIALPGAAPIGSNNSQSDPLFVDGTHGDLHLQSTSPARGAADPAADLTGVAADDADGHARVAPADLGAYQHAPGQ